MCNALSSLQGRLNVGSDDAFCVIGNVGGGVEKCHHEVRFETRRCSAPDPAGDRAYIALPDPLAGFRARGMGKGEWKGLGMEREWKGKERKGSI